MEARARFFHDEIDAKLASETNRQLYILSALTAAFLPPTLVAGLFGMNFEGLPWSGSVLGLLHCARPLPAVIGGGVAVPVERKPEIIHQHKIVITGYFYRRIWNTLPSYMLSHHVGLRSVIASKEWSIGVQNHVEQISVQSFWEPCWASAPWHFRVPAPPPQPCFLFRRLLSGEANAVSDGIVQVNHKKKWHKKYFNNRALTVRWTAATAIAISISTATSPLSH